MELKKNIVLFVTSLLSGGSEKQSLYLLYLLKEEHNVILVVFNDLCDDKNLDFIKKENLNVLFLRGSVLKKNIEFYYLLRRKKTEIIFSYLFSNNIIAAFIGKLSMTPIVIGGFRGSKGYGKFKMSLFKFIHNKVYHLTISNNYAGEEFLKKKGFVESKLKVIHNGIKRRKKTDILNTKPNKQLTILSVGRFDVFKDYFTALKAVDYLKKMCIQDTFKYIIIGYGNEKSKKELENWIQQLSLEFIVEIVINPSNINDFYNKADIYLSTSIYEGFSNSIMEAMMHQLPVVATNVGDNKYLIKNEVTGYLCKVKDFKSISNCLFHLTLSLKNRVNMGERGYDYICKNFELEIMKNKYLKLIKNL